MDADFVCAGLALVAGAGGFSLVPLATAVPAAATRGMGECVERG